MSQILTRLPVRDSTDFHLSDLDPKQRRLVDLMRDIGFGRIEGLIVQGGKPVFDPMPRIVQEHRLGSNDAAPARSSSRDCLLKSQVVELLDRLSELANGRVDLIVVKHGLPFSLTIVTSIG